MEAEGPDSYLFEHLLTRDAAYRALLERNRQRLHSLAGEALESQLRPGSLEEWSLLPRLVAHLAQAGRYAEAHSRCCDLLLLCAGSGQPELFGQWEQEALRLLELARPEAPRPLSSAALEMARGERIYLTMDYVPARERLVAAAALAEDEDDERSLCRALRRLSALELQRGMLEEAEQRAARALLLAQSLKDDEAQAACRSLQGWLAMRGREDYAAAESCYQQALELARRSGSLRSETVALNNYGILLHEHLGQPLRAAELWEQALVANRAMDNRVGEAINSDNLGGLLLELGQTASAARLLRVAVRCYGEVGDTPGVGSAGAKLGLAQLRMGELSAARAELERSCAILEGLDEDFWLAYTYAYLARLCLAEQQPAAALNWTGQCHKLAQQLDHPLLLLEAALVEGAARLALGHGTLARELAQVGFDAAQRAANPQGRAQALLLYARALVAGAPPAAAPLPQDPAAALGVARELLSALALPASAPCWAELEELQAVLP